MAPGDICLASFPFGDAPGMKIRPVLLLTGPLGPIPEVLVAYISSVVPPTLLTSDVLVDPTRSEFESTNLKTVSVLRLHKLATIHARSIVRGLGELDPGQQRAVAAKLRQLLGLGAG
jgi:mRNA-degrading endonuclease toxin of MazEF toxin-antitoxin module